MELKKVVTIDGYNRVRQLVLDNINPNANFRGTYYVAIEDGTTRGIVCLRPVTRYLTEVKHLWVKPEFRGAGVGKFLLQKVQERTSRPLLCATVVQGNEASLRAFTSEGYTNVAFWLVEETGKEINLLHKQVKTVIARREVPAIDVMAGGIDEQES